LKLKFYIDTETNEPHIYKHEISEAEIVEFFQEIKYLERKRNDKSYEAFGRIHSNRFLHVVYRKEAADVFFIITAYDIEDKELLNILKDFYESN